MQRGALVQLVVMLFYGAETGRPESMFSLLATEKLFLSTQQEIGAFLEDRKDKAVKREE